MHRMAAGVWTATTVLMALGCLLGSAKAEPPLFPGATPAYKSWTVAHLPGAPEGLTQDSGGRLYAAVSTTGEIVRLEAKGKYTRVAVVPSRELAEAGRTWGIGFGPDGDLYAAYVWHYSEAEEMDAFHLGCRNSKDQYTGVYRVNIKTGAVTPWVTKHDGWPLCFPDDVAVDSAGNVYVTDELCPGFGRSLRTAPSLCGRPTRYCSGRRTRSWRCHRARTISPSRQTGAAYTWSPMESQCCCGLV